MGDMVSKFVEECVLEFFVSVPCASEFGFRSIKKNGVEEDAGSHPWTFVVGISKGGFDFVRDPHDDFIKEVLPIKTPSRTKLDKGECSNPDSCPSLFG